jgi:Tfp pilus assembly protein PilV
MQRAWSVIRRGACRQGGFSPVEVLLAATVFAFLVTALIGAIVYGREGTDHAGERARAIALAEEGLEAVRNIRDASYASLSNGTTAINPSGSPSIWTLGGSTTIGIYTRQITIAQVDGDRKTVTSTVTWSAGGSSKQVSVTTRLTNWLATIIPPATPGPIMMVYSKTTTTPAYRIWQGLNWSGEGNATAVTGNIQHMVVKSSRTRNEAVLGVQTSTGAIFFQVWNGTTWGAATQVGTGPTTTRSFDIAYEKSGDRAVIAFTPSSGSADFAFRTWNGTTLSGATTITTPPTSGAVNWIETRQNPLAASNEIMLIMSDANADVYGMRWNGTTWVSMETVITWDTTAATNVTRKFIDVEYEQTSGEAMFVWGDSVSGTNNYRTWNGTTLANLQTVTIAAQGGVTDWLQLASRPSSNEIMMGIQDAGTDLNTVLWSGSGWGTPHTEHAATTENANSRNFDLVWETHASNPGEAWLMWGNGTIVNYKQYTGSWPGAASNLASGDDTAFIRLRADPVSGAVFAVLYEEPSGSATDDIWETHLTGGGTSWNAKGIMWGGPTTAVPAHFKVDISMP